MDKLYHAIACGDVQPPGGEIDAAIARHPSHRKCMAVVEGGRSALTSYRVVERMEFASLVEARLHTGRTHQVRVHLKHLGYPLVGDSVYGKKQNTLLAEQTGFQAGRQMLHARFLAFTHPTTEKRMVFESPWPQDFRSAMEALRLHSQKFVR